jgi:short-subunit dehydrogenase
MAMSDRPLADHRALVTGASSGIGAAIARRLAARGAGLVLTARRRDLLDGLAAELRATGVAVDVVVADLGQPGATADVWRAATAAGAIDILVNNAGFGHLRPFGEVELDRERELLQVNVVSLVELTHHFVTSRGPGRPGRRGHVMNVSSIAAWQAVPWFASYASSKGFVRDFSEAIHYELAGRGIAVTCLCPGGTKTDFHAGAGAGNYGALANISMLTAERVAEIGVRAMLRGKKTVVTGVLNKIACFFTSLAPRGLASRASVFVMGGERHGQLPPRAPRQLSSPPSE